MFVILNWGLRMSKYKIVTMPDGQDDIRAILEEYVPFLDAMVTPSDRALFGAEDFALEHWLFLWDNKAGYFVENRNEDGDLLSVAIIMLYNDLWHRFRRAEIHRVAFAQVPDFDDTKALNDLAQYLVSQMGILQFDVLYYNTRSEDGTEFKHLIWRKERLGDG